MMMNGASGVPLKYSAVWNNKIMKNKFGADRGIGSWSGNEPQDSVDPLTNTELGPPLDIHGPNASEVEHFNMNRVLLANIQRNDFFKSLARFRTVNEIIDEIYFMAQNTGTSAHKGADACPWVQGTHSNKSAGGMCSQVRGVATAGRPTNTWMYLVKLMTLRPTRRQIMHMLTHEDSPYIRIVAVFFVRYTQPPKELMGWLKELLHDTEPIKKQKLDKHSTTVAAIVAQLLTTHTYEDTYLPRLPPMVARANKAIVDEIGVRAAATAQRSGASRGGGGRGRSAERERGSGGGGNGRRDRSRSPPKRTAARSDRRSRSRSRDRAGNGGNHGRQGARDGDNAAPESRRRSNSQHRSSSRHHRRRSSSRDRRHGRSSSRDRRRSNSRSRRHRSRSRSKHRHKSSSARHHRSRSRDRGGNRERGRGRDHRRGDSRDRSRRSRDRRRSRH